MLKDISAQTVQGNVHLTVNLTHVNMRMDHVLVLQVGRVIIVQQVMLFKRKSTIPISKIALLNKFLIEITLKICLENCLIMPKQLYCPPGHSKFYRRKVKDVGSCDQKSLSFFLKYFFKYLHTYLNQNSKQNFWVYMLL